MRTLGMRLLVVLTAFVSVAAWAQNTPPALVNRITAPYDAPVASVDRGVTRSRPVTVDARVLQGIQSDLAVSPGVIRQVSIEFFPDRSFTIDLTRTESIGYGAVAFYGNVSGDPSSTAFIVQMGDIVSADVRAAGYVYQLRYRGAAGHEVRETDPRLFVESGNDAPEPTAQPATKAAQVVAQADTGSSIDVMVVWTPAARIAQGGVAAMQSLVTSGIAAANQAYTNSGVTQRLNLVYMGEVNLTEHLTSGIPDMSVDLPLLASNGDGVIDDVHTIRDAVGADFVSLWGEYTGGTSCGIGYLMASETSSFATNAFNVVDRSCAVGNLSFPHELGHNMGLRHDPYVDTSSTTINATPGPAGTIYYAHGYVDATNRMRTIMAYDNQCNAGGFSCSRLQYFSNPAVNMTSPYNSVSAPSGTNVNDPNPTSNESAALNQTLETTINFRTHVDQSGAGTVTFLLPTRTVSEGAGAITIAVSRLAGSTGAASVNYTVSPGSALAGTDYTATATGTLNWATGDTADKNVNVTIIDNAVANPSKTFTVTLSAPTGATLGSVTTQTVTIMDNEPGVFPPGCALPSGWIVPGTASAGWAPATDQSYEGTCSLKAQAIGNGQKAQIQYTTTFVAGNITFRRKVSSENGYDFFRFYIDGVVQGADCAEGFVCANSSATATGEADWTQPSAVLSFPVTAASHTITFSYEKDATCCTGGSDTAWIDAVYLPVNYQLTVNKLGAGTGTIASTSPPGGINCPGDCTEPYLNGTVVTLSATPASNAKFIGWSGACTGTGTCNVTMSQAQNVTATFNVLDVASPDWNLDGKPDLIWSNTANGNTYVWYMNGPVLITDAFIAGIDPSWKIQGVADFNGDGKPDLVWRNTTTGDCWVWYMNGSAFIVDAFLFSLPPQWVIQGVADFNKDGHPDFLMRNTDPASGVGFAWYFNNATAIGSDFLFGIDPTWKVENVADFNADGQPDLLFRNMTSGLAFAWYTQYSGVLSLAGSSPSLFSIDPAWEVVQATDWNADGQPDLVFRNKNTGVVFVWYMSGTALAGSDFIIQIDPSWEIVPRR